MAPLLRIYSTILYRPITSRQAFAAASLVTLPSSGAQAIRPATACSLSPVEGANPREALTLPLAHGSIAA
jgi:hypothetical protein